jgi:hypothetical protein
MGEHVSTCAHLHVGIRYAQFVIFSSCAPHAERVKPDGSFLRHDITDVAVLD